MRPKYPGGGPLPDCLPKQGKPGFMQTRNGRMLSRKYTRNRTVFSFSVPNRTVAATLLPSSRKKRNKKTHEDRSRRKSLPRNPRRLSTGTRLADRHSRPDQERPSHASKRYGRPHRTLPN